MHNERYLLHSKQYNAIADSMADVLHNTKAEHVEVARSALLRTITALALRSSNLQIGRMCERAGIPSSTTPTLTRR